MKTVLRRFVSAAAMLALASSTYPQAEIPVSSADVTPETGAGWAAMLSCGTCLVAGGLVLAGGPGAILLAINTPGSAIAVAGCATACYAAVEDALK